MFICIGTSNPVGTIYCNGAKMADSEKFYHLPMLSTTFFVVYTLIYSHYSTSFLLYYIYSTTYLLLFYQNVSIIVLAFASIYILYLAWLNTRVVHKLRLQEEGVGSPKMLTFCQHLQGRNVNGGEQVVKESQNHVNMICEQPPICLPAWQYHLVH